jgi:hypothetical protein
MLPHLLCCSHTPTRAHPCNTMARPSTLTVYGTTHRRLQTPQLTAAARTCWRAPQRWCAQAPHHWCRCRLCSSGAAPAATAAHTCRRCYTLSLTWGTSLPRRSLFMHVFGAAAAQCCAACLPSRMGQEVPLLVSCPPLSSEQAAVSTTAPSCTSRIEPAQLCLPTAPASEAPPRHPRRAPHHSRSRPCGAPPGCPLQAGMRETGTHQQRIGCAGSRLWRGVLVQLLLCKHRVICQELAAAWSLACMLACRMRT